MRSWHVVAGANNLSITAAFTSRIISTFFMQYGYLDLTLVSRLCRAVTTRRAVLPQSPATASSSRATKLPSSLLSPLLDPSLWPSTRRCNHSRSLNYPVTGGKLWRCLYITYWLTDKICPSPFSDANILFSTLPPIKSPPLFLVGDALCQKNLSCSQQCLTC